MFNTWPFARAGSNAVTIDARFNGADSSVSPSLSLFVSLLRCSDATRKQERNLLDCSLCNSDERGRKGRGGRQQEVDIEGEKEEERWRKSTKGLRCTHIHAHTYVYAYALKRCIYTCTFTRLHGQKHTCRLLLHIHTYKMCYIFTYRYIHR